MQLKNNKILLFIIGFSVLAIIGILLSRNKTDDSALNTTPGTQRYGNQADPANLTKDNCLADDCLLVEDLEYPAGELTIEVQKALDEAINDEYKALSTYEAVVTKLGTVRPFSMIIGAEEQHIASLKAIYDKYGLEVPVNTWPSKVNAPGTLQEACQVGVKAEIANAALYKDILLPAVKDYEDISAVFQNLMSASEQKHLPAFDKCN